MTEPDYDLDNDDAEDSDSERYVQLTRQQIRAMERDAKQARKAQEELAEARREIALTRAGLGDLSPAKQKALLANIDGDFTADAAKAAAVELGFLQAEPDSAPDVERQQMEQMSQASAGASDPGSEDSIARLDRAEREGGYEGLLAELRATGSLAGS